MEQKADRAISAMEKEQSILAKKCFEMNEICKQRKHKGDFK